ncbi:uncharacterized protein [Coffea arabica]|uniref:Uncharacterized protein isoform X3 n=1 Tax=Coffea arabica TaxID=13443 RepID=A0ABM4VKN4_COFAR
MKMKVNLVMLYKYGGTRGGKSYRGKRSFLLRDEDPKNEYNLKNEEGTGGGSDDEEPKKTRGPTYMRHIWGRHGTNKRIKMKFNRLENICNKQGAPREEKDES